MRIKILKPIQTHTHTNQYIHMSSHQNNHMNNRIHSHSSPGWQLAAGSKQTTGPVGGGRRPDDTVACRRIGEFANTTENATQIQTRPKTLTHTHTTACIYGWWWWLMPVRAPKSKYRHKAKRKRGGRHKRK